jgi:hypothetical protein
MDPDETHEDFALPAEGPANERAALKLRDGHAARSALPGLELKCITRYYSFGFAHVHTVNGFTYDKDIIVKVTAPDPRAVMFQMFGPRWSFEYTEETLDLSFFPRGVKDLSPVSAAGKATP